jgi:pyruvate ferredoxin oxidoreductase gamma subunit
MLLGLAATTVPRMFEVRIHGRGGQGVVTAAELLSIAAFDEGRYAQAFPSFGSERMGAPVVAFCRIGDSEIRSREPIEQPDALIVQDPTLVHQVDLFSGVEGEAYLLFNTARNLEELGLGGMVSTLRPERVRTVPATEIARRCLGRPLPNAALLGAFAGLTGVVSLASVLEAIRGRFPEAIAAGNVAAAQQAYAAVRPPIGELTGA